MKRWNPGSFLKSGSERLRFAQPNRRAQEGGPTDIPGFHSSSFKVNTRLKRVPFPRWAAQ